MYSSNDQKRARRGAASENDDVSGQLSALTRCDTGSYSGGALRRASSICAS
jgi:hypothetical protein